MLLGHNFIMNIKTIAFIFRSVQIMGCLLAYLFGPLQSMFMAPGFVFSVCLELLFKYQC